MNFPVMGAWVPVEYRPDDIIVHAPQPLLLEGRREGQPAALPRRAAVQALDLGRSRRAGRGRHRRLLQPRAGRKLRRGAEALGRADALRRVSPSGRAPSATTLLHEPLGQRLGRARRTRRRRSASSTATSTSARPSPWRIDRQRLGDSLVKGPFTAIYPGGLYAGTASTTRPRRSTIRSTSTAPRRSSQRPASRTPTATASSTSRPAPAGGKDVEITLLVNADYQHRQEPGRRRRRGDGEARHPGHPQSLSAAPT